MKKIRLATSIKSRKGFALAYVLVIVGAVVGIGSAFLLSTLSENKQASLHSKSLATFYTAQSGAEIAHLAFKRYIEEINEKTVGIYTWGSLQNINSYLEFLKHGTLGTPLGSSQTTLHLNLGTNNNYYLVYSSVPIINNIGNDTFLQASVTLKTLGPPQLIDEEGGLALAYPVQYTITSNCRCGDCTCTACTCNDTIIGEGVANIKFSSGNIANYALFMDNNKSPKNVPGWFHKYNTFDGPVHANDTLGFCSEPVFKDTVYTTGSLVHFFRKGNPIYNVNAIQLAPYDYPVFEKGIVRGATPKAWPANLIDLRKAVLQNDLNNPPSNDHYYFPKDNDRLIGGLYIPKDTPIELDSQGDKQLIRTVIKVKSGLLGLITKNETLEFEFDYANRTTTVRNVTQKTTLDTFNSLPNGGIYVAGEISSIKGVVNKHAALSIGAQKNIIIGGNITYEEDPRQKPSAKNILAIMTESGNILIPSNLPKGDLFIAATLIATAGNFETSGLYSGACLNEAMKNKGNLTVFGGLITKYFGYLGDQRIDNAAQYGYNQTTIYDIRAGNMALAPVGLPSDDNLQWSVERGDGKNTLDLIVWKKK